MMELTLIVFAMALVPGAVSQVAPTGDFFDCTRSSQTCTDGTCAADGLSCTCDATHTQVRDYLCVLAASATTTCALTCSGNGDCFVEDVTNQEKCYCDQKYYGDSCENPRIDVQCTGTEMTVTVKPHGTFGGKMYPLGFLGDSNCELTEQTGGSGVYSQTFSYTDCGMVETAVGAGGKKFSMNVLVQYNTNPDVLLANDQQLLATCTFSDSQTVTGEISQVDATDKLNQGTGDGDGIPLDFDIMDSAMNEIDVNTVVNVGDELLIYVTLQTNDVFSEFKVDRCIASNRKDTADADYASLDFVDVGGCPSDHEVVRGDHVMEDVTGVGKRIAIPLYAFMFAKGSTNNINSLFLTCDILFCVDSSVATCNAPASCPNDFTTGFGRRRRAAGEESMQVSQGLTVRFAPQDKVLEVDSNDSLAGMADTGECLKNPILQTVVAVLGVLLLALLLALLGVIVLCHRRSRRNEKYVDDSHSLASSTRTLNMEIPRPRV